MGCYCTITPWKNRYYVRSGYHDRSSSGIRRCQNPLQQHRPWLRPSPFLDPVARLPVMRTRVLLMTPSMLLVFAWARFRLARTASAFLPTVAAESPAQVYGLAGNLGNECADHAAALGAFGWVSNHNLSTRWTHHFFDSASCFATCYNLGDVLEKLRDIRTEHISTSQLQNRDSTLFFTGFSGRPFRIASHDSHQPFGVSDCSIVSGCCLFLCADFLNRFGSTFYWLSLVALTSSSEPIHQVLV